MLNLKIAITGGLSCGKSSVCRIFKELGAHVVDADKVVHQLLTPNTNLGQLIINLLGPDIIVKGQLSRDRISDKVFNNRSLLKSLEKLLHPAVHDEIERQYKQIGNNQLFIAEIPLLFETRSEKYYKKTIAIISDPELCLERFKKATNYDKDQFDARMKRQLDPMEKAKKADYVIVNNSSIETLKETVHQLFVELTKGYAKNY